MMAETEQFKAATIRLKYETAMLKQYAKKNGILYSQIQNKTGIKNISRFMNNKMQTPSFITFLLISEAIGFEVSISLKEK